MSGLTELINGNREFGNISYQFRIHKLLYVAISNLFLKKKSTFQIQSSLETMHETVHVFTKLHQNGFRNLAGRNLFLLLIRHSAIPATGFSMRK